MDEESEEGEKGNLEEVKEEEQEKEKEVKAEKVKLKKSKKSKSDLNTNSSSVANKKAKILKTVQEECSSEDEKNDQVEGNKVRLDSDCNFECLF